MDAGLIVDAAKAAVSWISNHPVETGAIGTAAVGLGVAARWRKLTGWRIWRWRPFSGGAAGEPQVDGRRRVALGVLLGTLLGTQAGAEALDPVEQERREQEQAQREQEQAQREQERVQREQEQAQREQERVQREQERREREQAEREQERRDAERLAREGHASGLARAYPELRLFRKAYRVALPAANNPVLIGKLSVTLAAAAEAGHTVAGNRIPVLAPGAPEVKVPPGATGLMANAYESLRAAQAGVHALFEQATRHQLEEANKACRNAQNGMAAALAEFADGGLERVLKPLPLKAGEKKSLRQEAAEQRRKEREAAERRERVARGGGTGSA